MRLIDADAIETKLRTKLRKLVQSRPDLAAAISYTGDIIADAPTIDAVPVVRCEDCKYWKSYGGSMKYYGECEGTSKEEMWGEDDFCSHGERKDGE